jgi:hypothetical protein
MSVLYWQIESNVLMVMLNLKRNGALTAKNLNYTYNGRKWELDIFRSIFFRDPFLPYIHIERRGQRILRILPVIGSRDWLENYQRFYGIHRVKEKYFQMLTIQEKNNFHKEKVFTLKNFSLLLKKEKLKFFFFTIVMSKKFGINFLPKIKPVVECNPIFNKLRIESSHENKFVNFVYTEIFILNSAQSYEFFLLLVKQSTTNEIYSQKQTNFYNFLLETDLPNIILFLTLFFQLNKNRNIVKSFFDFLHVQEEKFNLFFKILPQKLLFLNNNFGKYFKKIFVTNLIYEALHIFKHFYKEHKQSKFYTHTSSTIANNIRLEPVKKNSEISSLRVISAFFFNINIIVSQNLLIKESPLFLRYNWEKQTFTEFKFSLSSVKNSFYFSNRRFYNMFEKPIKFLRKLAVVVTFWRLPRIYKRTYKKTKITVFNYRRAQVEEFFILLLFVSISCFLLFTLEFVLRLRVYNIYFELLSRDTSIKLVMKPIVKYLINLIDLLSVSLPIFLVIFLVFFFFYKVYNIYFLPKLLEVIVYLIYTRPRSATMTFHKEKNNNDAINFRRRFWRHIDKCHGFRKGVYIKEFLRFHKNKRLFNKKKKERFRLHKRLFDKKEHLRLHKRLFDNKERLKLVKMIFRVRKTLFFKNYSFACKQMLSKYRYYNPSNKTLKYKYKVKYFRLAERLHFLKSKQIISPFFAILLFLYFFSIVLLMCINAHVSVMILFLFEYKDLAKFIRKCWNKIYYIFAVKPAEAKVYRRLFKTNDTRNLY